MAFRMAVRGTSFPGRRCRRRGALDDRSTAEPKFRDRKLPCQHLEMVLKWLQYGSPDTDSDSSMGPL